MLSTVVFLFAVLLVVAWHELGHLLACRVFGIKVDSFNVGFGPSLITHKGVKNDWSLRAIPLGGYVSMDVESLEKKHPWKRIVVSLAGPVFNLIPIMLLTFPILGVVATLSAGWGLYIDTIVAIVKSLGRSIDFFHLIPPDPAHELAGIVQSNDVLGEVTKKDGLLITFILSLFALNVGLGIFNLIPLFPLDGGRIVVDTVSWVNNKWSTHKVTVVAKGVSTIILLWLIIVVNVGDIVKLF
jgi:regulator of sigma E protease